MFDSGLVGMVTVSVVASPPRRAGTVTWSTAVGRSPSRASASSTRSSTRGYTTARIATVPVVSAGADVVVVVEPAVVVVVVVVVVGRGGEDLGEVTLDAEPHRPRLARLDGEVLVEQDQLGPGRLRPG